FHAHPLAANPVWLLIHAWPAELRRNEWKDIVVNIALYAPLGLFGFLAAPARWRVGARVWAAVATGFVLSCGIEMLQLFDASRSTSALDVLSNTIGAAIGAAWGAMFERRFGSIQTELGSGRWHASGAMLLLVSL